MRGILGFAAATWAVVMAVSPLLQLRRMWQRKSAADVSVGYLLILIPGFGLWVAYGLAGSDLALVVPNVAALVVGAFTAGYALRLRRAEANHAMPKQTLSKTEATGQARSGT